MKNREINPAFFNQNRDKGGNNLNSLDIKIKNAKTSGTLNLSSLNLEQLPPQVFDVYAGTETKFWEVEPIKNVDISFNKLNILPPELGSLSECVSLKARDNLLTSIPETIWQGCSLLRHLDLTKNKLTSLSDAIGNLQDLREFLLSTNSLSSLPGSIGTCRNLKVLDLQGNGLQTLPRELMSLSLVTHLNVSHNKLTTFPCPSLSDMRSLQVLICGSNSLSNLPDLSQNQDLLTLDATVNKLNTFPCLPAVVQTDHQTSSSSSKTKGMTHLSLGYNRITSLSKDALLTQPRLVELLVNDNQLVEVPGELEFLSSLKVLDVSNNSVRDLSASLGYLESLQHLRVDGNPIRSIRQNLLVGPTHDLKTYLRTRGPSLRSDAVTEKHKELESELAYRVRNTSQGLLDLSGLNLSVIPSDLISLVQSLPNNGRGVTCLGLSKNQLESLPMEVLEQLSWIVSLDISYNHLHRLSSLLTSSQIHSSLTNLKVSGNKLSCPPLHLLLLPFPHLKELDCSVNVLQSLSMDLLLPRGLEKINLSFCQLQNIDTDFSSLKRLVKVIEWIRSRVAPGQIINPNINNTNSSDNFNNNNHMNNNHNNINNNYNNNNSLDNNMDNHVSRDKKQKKIQTLKQLNSRDFQF